MARAFRLVRERREKDVLTPIRPTRSVTLADGLIDAISVDARSHSSKLWRLETNRYDADLFAAQSYPLRVVRAANDSD